MLSLLKIKVKQREQFVSLIYYVKLCYIVCAFLTGNVKFLVHEELRLML